MTFKRFLVFHHSIFSILIHIIQGRHRIYLLRNLVYPKFILCIVRVMADTAGNPTVHLDRRTILGAVTLAQTVEIQQHKHHIRSLDDKVTELEGKSVAFMGGCERLKDIQAAQEHLQLIVASFPNDLERLKHDISTIRETQKELDVKQNQLLEIVRDIQSCQSKDLNILIQLLG